MKAFDLYPISALLNGPDSQYERILMQENEKSSALNTNEQYQDKNSFLQIHVRPLNTKQQKRLLEKQSRRHYQSIKSKCLQFTFPITYPCLMKSKRKQPIDRSSPSISSSEKKSNSQLSNDLTRLKSAVSILFNDERGNSISKGNLSSNACTQNPSCQSCGSILSDGVCSCIVQNLLRLNSSKSSNILVEFKDIFANLTSNNIIT